MSQTSPAANLRRPGVLGVHSLDHFVLSVPDLEVANTFYTTFGLEVKAEGGGLGLYTFGHPHCWGKLVRGAEKRLSRLCFACFEDDFPRFRDKLAQLGVKHTLADGALQFSDPAGMAVSIMVGERTAAAAVAPFVNEGGTLGGRTAPMRSEAPRVRPNRLSHLAMFTRDIDTIIDFYQSALGLGLSDRSADIVAFMHGVHGSDHHMLALLNSTGPGLHHTSWEVSSINEIGLGADHMAQAGHAIQWGLGRHVLGSNYFTYVRDPWGSWAEYSAGIDYVPVDMEYRWADHAPEDSFFLWGPPPPPVFTDNVEQGA